MPEIFIKGAVGVSVIFIKGAVEVADIFINGAIGCQKYLLRELLECQKYLLWGLLGRYRKDVGEREMHQLSHISPISSQLSP